MASSGTRGALDQIVGKLSSLMVGLWNRLLREAAESPTLGVRKRHVGAVLGLVVDMGLWGRGSVK